MLAPSAVASRFRVLVSRGLAFMGFRAGQLSKEDALKRIEVRVF